MVDLIPSSWADSLLPGLGQITGSSFPQPHNADSFKKCLSVSALPDSENTTVGETRQLKRTVYYAIQVNNIYGISCYREEIKWGDVNKGPHTVKCPSTTQGGSRCCLHDGYKLTWLGLLPQLGFFSSSSQILSSCLLGHLVDNTFLL